MRRAGSVGARRSSSPTGTFAGSCPRCAGCSLTCLERVRRLSARCGRALGRWPDLDALDVSAEDRELLGEVIGFYHQTLRESPEALRFLERRRIAHPEAVERFRLGFANRTLGYRLPDRLYATKRGERPLIRAVGGVCHSTPTWSRTLSR